MPAVEPETLLDVVVTVSPDDLGESAVGRRVLRVLDGAVGPLRVEVVAAAEIVFRAGAADGREFLVAVEEELDLALAPPAVVVHSPGHVRADILPPAFDPVEDRVNVFVRQGIDPPELRVKISRVIGNVRQGVVDLVVDREILLGDILERDPESLPEGHRPVAVEGPPGVDADGERGDLGVLPPAAGEEIAHRALDRRLGLAVPIEPDDGEPPGPGRRQPDLLD